MALLQEVSRGGIEGSSLEEEWGELRQAVSQDPQLSRLYNEYAREALLAREEQRQQEAGGGRWKVDARGRRIRKRRRGRKEEAEGEEGMSSKARTEERLRRWRAGVVEAATQSTVVEVATMVVLTVLPIAAGAFVYVNVQEWLKAMAPQPAVVEKEPWWMLFGPAASAAGTVFGMAGLGFAAKTAAAAPVAVAVVPQMDALWRSFGGASLVALYWRTLVFGKTFRSIEWDLEAYDAPNGSMKSITIRVPSLNAVRTKIALANGLAGASEVQQLALWIPNSGDFVEPLRLAKDLALIPDFGFVIWSRTPASLHCLPSRAAKTMPSPTAAAGSAGAARGADMAAIDQTETETNTAAAEKTETGAAAKESETLVKHPLEHRWTLWFDNPQQRGKSGGSWGSSLRVIFTFGTVEDFWCLYNNIVQPSKLMNKADMHLFKEGIQPKWEDPKCEKGGSWTIPCSRSKEYLDNMWLHLMLAMIGEQIDEGNDICGAVVSIRPNKDRVALWTKSAASESIQTSIGKQLKEILGITEQIGFSSFADQKGSRKRSATPETTMLYVGCLTRNVNQDHLREIFGLYGELSKVEIAMDRVVNLPKGYGYVEFKKRADAEKARLHMDGAQIDGSVVSAQFVLAPKPVRRPEPLPPPPPSRRTIDSPPRRRADGGRTGRQGGVAAAEVPRASRRRKGKVAVPAPRGKEALARALPPSQAAQHLSSSPCEKPSQTPLPHPLPRPQVAPTSPPLLPHAAALPPSPFAPRSSLQPRPDAPPLSLPHTLTLPALSAPAPAPTTARPQVSFSTAQLLHSCAPPPHLFPMPSPFFLASSHFSLHSSFVRSLVSSLPVLPPILSIHPRIALSLCFPSSFLNRVAPCE
ncbi:unnamed protein product [Closterium sp. Yama58-4]|nr:unnamed protein product [Closterium sp. Yama58-4]